MLICKECNMQFSEPALVNDYECCPGCCSPEMEKISCANCQHKMGVKACMKDIMVMYGSKPEGFFCSMHEIITKVPA